MPVKTEVRRWIWFLILGLLPTLYLEAISLAAGALFTVTGAVARWGACLGIGLLAAISLPRQKAKNIWIWPWPGAIIASLGTAAGIFYALTSSTLAGWGVVLFIFALCLDLDSIFTPLPPESLSAGRGKALLRLLIRGGVHATFALAAGCLVVIITQLEANFAEEEFFVALQALALAGFWLVLRVAWGIAYRPFPAKTDGSTRYLPFDTRWLAAGMVLLAIALLATTVRSYQRSFYPSQASTFPGISAENPFLCGQVPADPQTYNGTDVFHRILALVEANPNKTAPEYGMLALGTGEAHWAESFHDSLLDEAQHGLFTGPAGSVKSVQYDAALRVYYYPRVRDAFSGLFTTGEIDTLQHWFYAINRRALTVEWVDWLYALALGKLPAGPYENQENGAGLLSLLEKEGLADPELSSRNRDYLTRNPRGWVQRFRVTDDAAMYQPEWITNAYFQSLYTGQAPSSNVQSSFEWLLLQALPDGAPLRYNHVGVVSMDEIAYLGAELLGDDSYLWMAGRAMDYRQAAGTYLIAQPGLEQALDWVGNSPTYGSCLLYGDSGMPTKIGPLALDKIVFRDGWTEDSAYLLLNLRFTGWHRYKATNTVSLVYQNGSLAAENLSGKRFEWLPTGRSLFRDKRVPRENLNGLVIGRTGVSAVLYTLTGIGGPWAQDPPYYATVERFETSPEMDVSTTVIENWHGWTHRRSIYFVHDGPIIVLDEASGPSTSPAELVWHLPGGAQSSGQRIRLREGESPAEAVLLPNKGEIHYNSDEAGMHVLVSGTGSLSLTTVFLTNDWAGAEITATSNSLTILGKRSVTIPLGE
jgi:hypothetical protein